MQEIQPMTFKELKEVVKQLEVLQVSEETKVFLDTGWDSIQEVVTGSIQVKQSRSFMIEDELNGEVFKGYSLAEKAEKMKATGSLEDVIIIEHLY